MPVFLIGAGHLGDVGLAPGGRLADVAPTLLAMLDVPQHGRDDRSESAHRARPKGGVGMRLPICIAVAMIWASATVAQSGFGAPVSDEERASILTTGRGGPRPVLPLKWKRMLRKPWKRRIGTRRESGRSPRKSPASKLPLPKPANAWFHSRKVKPMLPMRSVTVGFGMLRLLLRWSRCPRRRGPAIIAHDGDASVAARSATALDGLRAALEVEARTTHRRMIEIRELRLRTEAAREDAKAAIDSLRERERELWKLVGKRRDEGQAQIAHSASLRRDAERLAAQAAALNVAVQRSPSPGSQTSAYCQSCTSSTTHPARTAADRGSAWASGSTSDRASDRGG